MGLRRPVLRKGGYQSLLVNHFPTAKAPSATAAVTATLIAIVAAADREAAEARNVEGENEASSSSKGCQNEARRTSRLGPFQLFLRESKAVWV